MLAAVLLSVGLAGQIVEERAQIRLEAADAVHWKRFVLRYPSSAEEWNGVLVVAAHGGSGGRSFSRDGAVTGTDETALDDVVGEPAIARGFAYASVDRDGIGGTREGLALTKAFTESMARRLTHRLGRAPDHVYLAGLSMGGGIARYAAEEGSRDGLYDGVLIIVGAHGDQEARRERSRRMAAIWPRIGELGDEAYAEAVGTPVAARRLWPFMGESTARRAASEPSPDPEEADTTGEVAIPTLEIAGTFDDFVYPEVLLYQEKVRRRGAASRYRLFAVEGAWHISPEDDAMGSFQYLGSRLGLSEESVDAMATGASYLPAVRDALVLLDRWVREGSEPPPGRGVRASEPLSPLSY